MRACAERVAPRDRCCRLDRRRHRDRQGRQALAGGEAPVLGHARQDRQLPDRGLACTRSASGGRCRSAGRCTCPRSGATTCARRRKAKIPDEVVFETKPQLAGGLCEQAAGWEIPRGADPGRLRLRRRQRLPHAPARVRARVRARRVGAEIERLRPGDDLRRARAQRHGGRPRSVARPDRKPESVRALAERLPAKAWQTLPVPDDPGGRGRLEPLRLRPRRRHPPGPQPTTSRRAGSG